MASFFTITLEYDPQLQDTAKAGCATGLVTQRVQHVARGEQRNSTMTPRASRIVELVGHS